MIVRERFPKWVAWKGSTALSTTAVSIDVAGRDCVFKNISGNTWVNPSATATAAATSYLMAAGEQIQVNCDTLSIISDGTGSTYAYYILEG